MLLILGERDRRQPAVIGRSGGQPCPASRTAPVVRLPTRRDDDDGPEGGEAA